MKISTKERCKEVIKHIKHKLEEMNIEYRVLFDKKYLASMSLEEIEAIDCILKDSPVFVEESIEQYEKVYFVHLQTYCLANGYDANKLLLIVEYYFGINDEDENFKEIAVDVAKDEQGNQIIVDCIFNTAYGCKLYITDSVCTIKVRLKNKYNQYAAKLTEDFTGMNVSKGGFYLQTDFSNVLWIKKRSFHKVYGESFSYPMLIWKPMKDYIDKLENGRNEY